MDSASPLQQPVWEAPAGPPGRLPARAETLIIGGGITGVALLHWFGRGAVLVERGANLAAGASGRNAGFLMAGIAANHAEAVARYGPGLAAEIYAFTLETHRLLAEALGGRAEYRRRGSWRIAAGEEEAEQLKQSAALLADQGFEASFAGDRLLTPGDGELHPAAAVAALASGSSSSIQLGVRVERIEPAAGCVRIATGDSECVAETVVLATNAYTAQLMPDVPIRPVRAQMLASAPVPVPVVQRPSSADRGFRYWRQRADGRVLVGGYRNLAFEEEVGYDERPTARLQDHLEKHLRGLGVEEPVTHRWAGIMGFTEDDLPLVGAVPGVPGVFICGGYTGHGWAFAFQAARLLVELIRGRGAPPPWLSPGRFSAAATG